MHELIGNLVMSENAVPEIDVETLRAMLEKQQDEPFELIDVREQQEYDVCMLDGATLIPLMTLPTKLDEMDKSKKYVVHCKLGGRSAQAVAFMRGHGFDAVNVAGGIKAWRDRIDPSLKTYW